MNSTNDTWSLPFATGVAVQRYLTAEEGLEAAREERCSHWYVDASLMEDMPHNWSQERSRKLVEAAEEHGLSPILHGNFRAPLASEIPEVRQASLEYVRSEIDLAARTKSTALVIHGGAFVEPRPTKAHRDAALERFTSLLSIIEGEAADKGVEVWLENLSYYPKSRPFSYVFTREADFATVLDAIPQVKFVLDVGHANVNQALALPAFEAFAPSIAALSLSNNEGNQDAHLGLGDGTLSVRELTDAIRAKNWSGVIAFETRNASVEAGIDYLRAMWEAETDANLAVTAGV
ncbi:sugar phosphate isomerase/epimerase [Streptomyces sp. RPA4-5]|uniref:sugar phosphate isomerase/epimerase family protein n=1 Tax=Streptomyces sp. RPA4-5 TaxID=2721245 RepID=UPI00143EE0B7|nr:sugar phosphate isomerase/epimerase family protein [Streptomyces sp. RPA4-5]QIY59008.1 sugar phosphate isomerase/epimerase [Streptomyces sp. RPA4-5]